MTVQFTEEFAAKVNACPTGLIVDDGHFEVMRHAADAQTEQDYLNRWKNELEE